MPSAVSPRRHADQQGNRARRHQPPGERASAADLAKIARGQRGTGSVYWLRHRPGRGREHRLRRKRPAGHGHAAEPRHQPALYRRVTEIIRTLQAIGRNRNRILGYLPLDDADLQRLRRSRAGGYRLRRACPSVRLNQPAATVEPYLYLL